MVHLLDLSIRCAIMQLWADAFSPPQSKYKEASKKEMQSGSFTTLPETRDTVHSKEVNKLISGVSKLNSTKMKQQFYLLG